MTQQVPAASTAASLFDGPPAPSFVGLVIETTVQDVSPAGDTDRALALGRVRLEDASPPSGVPEFVSVTETTVTLVDQPYLTGELSVSTTDTALNVEAALDSGRDLLIDPPVEVTLSGPAEAVAETLEQTIATIYRTRGRYLEQIEAGIEEPQVD